MEIEEHDYPSQPPQSQEQQQIPLLLAIYPLQPPPQHQSQLPQQPNIPNSQHPQQQLHQPLQESVNETTTIIKITTTTSSTNQELKPKDAALKTLQEKETSHNSQLNFDERQHYEAMKKEIAGKLYFLDQLLDKEAEDPNQTFIDKATKYTIIEKAWKTLPKIQSNFLKKKTELEMMNLGLQQIVKNLEEDRNGAQFANNFVIEQLQKKVIDAELQTEVLTARLQTCSNEKFRLESENRRLNVKIVRLEGRLDTADTRNRRLTKEVRSLERDKKGLQIQKSDFQSLSIKLQPLAKQMTTFVFDKEKLIQQRDKYLQENVKLKSSVNSLRGRCNELINSERNLTQKAEQDKIPIETLEKKLKENLTQKHEQSTQKYDAELGTKFQTVQLECGITQPITRTTSQTQSIAKSMYYVLEEDKVLVSVIPATVAVKKNARKLESQGNQSMSKRRNQTKERTI
ncbi:unnamed protein product [Orchesella dallaii]|uniref:DUF4201 domain-containing protein n=1 Tax=Orchesella dallaii TaxID=48710 RepID=A0ABP1RHV0_9HEXA